MTIGLDDVYGNVQKYYGNAAIQSAPLTIAMVQEAWEKISGRSMVEVDPLDELLGKAGVKEDERDVERADRDNQYDEERAEYRKGIVKKNSARVWETREEGDTAEDVVLRTLGILPTVREEKPLDVMTDVDYAATLKRYYGIEPDFKPTGKLTGLTGV